MAVSSDSHAAVPDALAGLLDDAWLSGRAHGGEAPLRRAPSTADAPRPAAGSGRPTRVAPRRAPIASTTTQADASPRARRPGRLVTITAASLATLGALAAVGSLTAGTSHPAAAAEPSPPHLTTTIARDQLHAALTRSEQLAASAERAQARAAKAAQRREAARLRAAHARARARRDHARAAHTAVAAAESPQPASAAAPAPAVARAPAARTSRPRPSRTSSTTTTSSCELGPC